MKRKLKIVADNKIPFLQGVLEPHADILYLPGKEITRDWVRDADAIIIRTRTRCDKELLENTKVRFIATATIGFDHIDADYCASHKITWTNAPGCNSSSVEQYMLSALMALSIKKNIKLKNKTIGIIGVGHVGSRVERVARLMEMKVLLNDPPRERNENLSHFVSLERIMKESDFISFHVPLLTSGRDKTFHMGGHHFFNILDKKVHLLNTSRGEVIDEKALKTAIKSGKLASVVLDVWENEPSIDTELAEMVDIATPHIAGYSLDGKAKGTSMSIQALSRYFDLGLDDWKPGNIPAPTESKIMVDGTGKDKQEVVSEAVLKTYSILEDDDRFRRSVGSFEEQREHYPNRREYAAYTLQIVKDISEATSVLAQLGFKICENQNK
jgi:erythronate-4-phosphate dehydrogenase